MTSAIAWMLDPARSRAHAFPETPHRTRSLCHLADKAKHAFVPAPDTTRRCGLCVTRMRIREREATP